MSDDLSHLRALNESLSRERSRLREAKSSKDIEFRKHQIEMKIKEIEGEISFLKKKGVKITPDLGPVDDDISDDELLAELGVSPKKSSIRWT